MKVLVTGATGFIGKALVKRLIAKGHEVIILTRSIHKANETFANLDITAAQWDAKTSQGWLHHADGVYAIMNLAGERITGLWTESKKQRILQSRLDAINAIVEAVQAVKTKPQVVIHGSAICYPSDTVQPCDESSPYGTNFLSEVSRQCEASASRIKDIGTRLVLIRTGIVLGKDGGALEPIVRSFKFFLGGYFGSGKQYLSWVSLDDEIDAILFLMEHKDLSGPFNLSSPQSLPMKEFCRILGKILKRPCLFSIPPFAARLAMGQMADELLLSGQNAVPKRLLELGYVFKHPNIEEALLEILRKA